MWHLMPGESEQRRQPNKGLLERSGPIQKSDGRE